MKHLLLSALLALTAPAFAHDFVNHSDNQPQNLPDAQVQVINFWGSYCKPCRKEMPDMSKWYTQTGKKQKVFMVGIALDSQENINTFLKETPVKYPIWRYVGNSSRNMMKQFGNTKGVLPYTVIRAPKCGYEQQIVGELTLNSLNQAVKIAQAACKK